MKAISYRLGPACCSGNKVKETPPPSSPRRRQTAASSVEGTVTAHFPAVVHPKYILPRPENGCKRESTVQRSRGVHWRGCVVLATFWLLLPGHTAAQFKDDANPPEANAKAVPGKLTEDDGKDTRLSLDDIRAMRTKHIPPAQVADSLAEQGRRLRGHGRGGRRAPPPGIRQRTGRRHQGCACRPCRAREVVAHAARRHVARQGFSSDAAGRREKRYSHSTRPVATCDALGGPGNSAHLFAGREKAGEVLPYQVRGTNPFRSGQAVDSHCPATEP